MQPLGLAALCDALADPDAAERFSPLATPWLLADLREGPPPLSETQARVLSSLPCVTAAWLPENADARDPRWRPFDVLSRDEVEIDGLAAAVRAQPIAAVALVQLLRLGERTRLEDALVAESLTYAMLQAGPGFAAWCAARKPPRPRPVAPGPAVRVEREGTSLRLTLDRPEKRNAYSVAMRDALCEGLAIALADVSIARVLLRGNGPAFCSGGDLDEFGTLPDPATAHAVRCARHAGRLVAACAERVEVFVHGTCVGAGIEIPAFAGRVVAAPDARFRLPEVAMGLVPGAGGTASLPRRMGRQRTAAWALAGTELDARTALAWGLVDALEPDPAR